MIEWTSLILLVITAANFATMVHGILISKRYYRKLAEVQARERTSLMEWERISMARKDIGLSSMEDSRAYLEAVTFKK